ncbi:DUF4062 domain-containing protein [Pseudohalocynthiibacter aestuariivivens]|uniref:DUF4062 domain-containing protein n=1 Tax=Pseudohalocynthiibacter aestuariivivens TaxID=1591409 RepID=A0ABV5JJ95_9RHOB|nr:DUF4062 domain-containing protein [Pseudohalocynthiibacter aestuariivivens]
MTDKRYQVFISSTFEDLREERRAVQDLVISTGDFPVQMESFPAADEDQFEFIKSLIDQCDYYVLIIAARYGTVADDGMSYTEKEYHYAASKGVPVLVMLHSNRGSIATDKSEETPEGKERLRKFIEEVSKGRLRKTWDSIGVLKLAVREALENAKATKPRVGWVRGDAVASVEALEELNEVRKENLKFRDALGQFEVDIPLPEIPDHDEKIEIDIFPSRRNTGFGSAASTEHVARIRGSWISLFPIFYSNLKWGVNDWNDEYFYHINEEDSCVSIGSALASEVSGIDAAGTFKLNHNALEKLTSYFIESGFMKPDNAGEPFSEMAKRYARRVRIRNDPGSGFELVSGQFDVEDEIPF